MLGTTKIVIEGFSVKISMMICAKWFAKSCSGVSSTSPLFIRGCDESTNGPS